MRRPWLAVLALCAALAWAGPRLVRSRDWANAFAWGQASRATVTLVGLSDYHSHAVPFFSEGRPGQGGMARVAAFLRQARKDPHTLVLSGGDTMNAGTPTWSDEYRCLDWPWLDGLVDAMALGNHELDYGAATFDACRASVRFPVLAANLVSADGRPYLTTDGKPYVVKEVAGVRIGVFALAGADFRRLVQPANMPAGTSWADPIAAAREVVKALRETEKVAAVAFIGHQALADDEAMAHAVPGIDVILGSHSHLKSELRLVPGTRTWLISPYQYLAYVSTVRLGFEEGRLASVEGELVRMDEGRPEAPDVAQRVAALQAQLVAKRPDRFRVVGRLPEALTDEGVSTREAPIGRWATEALRRAAGAHAFFAIASSFRASLPGGEVLAEDFYAAIPYRNTVVVAELTGGQVVELLALSLAKAGSDGFSQQSGLRYDVRDGRPVDVRVRRDPADARDVAVERDAVYRIATSDFQAFVADGYRELFAGARAALRTSLDAHAILLDALKAEPVDAPRGAR